MDNGQRTKQPLPAVRLQPRGDEERFYTARRPCPITPPEHRCQREPTAEQVREHKVPPGPEDARALSQAGLLVSPMVERDAADHDVEGSVGERQPFGRSLLKAHPAGRLRSSPGDGHHARCRVHADQPGGLRKRRGKQSQELPSPATDVEEGRGGSCHRAHDIRDLSDQPPVQGTTPAGVAGRRAAVEGSDVLSLATRPVVADSDRRGAGSLGVRVARQRPEVVRAQSPAGRNRSLAREHQPRDQRRRLLLHRRDGVRVGVGGGPARLLPRPLLPPAMAAHRGEASPAGGHLWREGSLELWQGRQKLPHRGTCPRLSQGRGTEPLTRRRDGQHRSLPGPVAAAARLWRPLEVGLIAALLDQPRPPRRWPASSPSTNAPPCA